MPYRRPEPAGFTEDIKTLAELNAELAETQRRIDDLVLDLIVEKRASTTLIAKRMGVSFQAVGRWRDAALRRRVNIRRAA